MNIRYSLLALLLLGVIFALACTAQAFTNDVCDKTQTGITEALDYARNGQFDKSADRISDLAANLERKKVIFTVVQHHSYVDSIIAALCRAEICARAGEASAMELELASAVLEITSLAGRDQLTLGNIF